MNAAFGERIIRYYEERAKGGAGLIITGSTTPNHQLENQESPLVNPKRFVVQTKKLADCVHSYGAKLFYQFQICSGRNLAPRSRRFRQIIGAECPHNIQHPKAALFSEALGCCYVKFISGPCPGFRPGRKSSEGTPHPHDTAPGWNSPAAWRCEASFSLHAS